MFFRSIVARANYVALFRTRMMRHSFAQKAPASGASVPHIRVIAPPEVFAPRQANYVAKFNTRKCRQSFSVASPTMKVIAPPKTAATKVRRVQNLRRIVTGFRNVRPGSPKQKASAGVENLIIPETANKNSALKFQVVRS